jgi:methanogenic corrinoid protein MtbC1
VGSNAAFVVTLLDTGARAVASRAAETLLESQPELEARFQPDPYAGWMDHFTGRIGQLAAAMSAGAPALFAADVAWARAAFESRAVPIDDLRASLDALEAAVDESLPDHARGACARCFESARARLDEPAPRHSPLEAGTPEARLAGEYLVAILEGDRRRAIATVLDAVAGDMTHTDAYLKALVPAEQEIGRMWHAGEMSVGEEHFATATTELVLSLLYPGLPRREPHGRTCIVAGAQGNMHRLPVRIVADFLECDGWRVIDLGVDLPARDIAKAAADFGADLICLSVTLSTHLRPARAVIEAVRGNKALAGARVLVGGQAFDAAPETWRSLGADGMARGIEEAQRAARDLVGLPPAE